MRRGRHLTGIFVLRIQIKLLRRTFILWDSDERDP